MRKPINFYCKENDNWVKFSNSLIQIEESETSFFCSFFNQELGLNMIASVEDLEVFNIIHLTLAPMKSFKTMQDDEWKLYITDWGFKVAELFFPDLNFTRQPDSLNFPLTNHYYTVLPPI